MELNGPAGFSDDGRAVLERTVDVDTSTAQQLRNESMNEDQLAIAYEIKQTVACILANNYQRIALQMPDSMLCDSAWVARQLREQTGRSVFILADTSYGSCCVDEIAAQHIDADFIVHYGPSCLSATQRLPVMYVFGRGPIDTKACAIAFDKLYNEHCDDNIVIVSDVIYQYAIEHIVTEIQRISSNYTHLMVATALTESRQKTTTTTTTTTTTSLDTSNSTNGNNQCCTSISEGCCQQSTGSCNANECGKPNRMNVTINEQDKLDDLQHHTSQLTGRELDLPSGVTLNDCRIFYIGEESRTLTNLLMTHNKTQVHSFAPTTNAVRLESASVNRALMKRYYLVQKAKDAEVIGIVAGTLGVVSYMQVIEHLKQTIRNAGKKFYFFSVGKLNVAKLANFPEIDVFVLVACPENSLIDGKDFYQPVITPFELELALVSGREWTGEFTVNFKEILENGHNDQLSVNDTNDTLQDEDEDDIPRFSLVSGQLKHSSKYTLDDNNQDTTTSSASASLDDQMSSLTLRNQNSQLTTWKNSPAAKYLAQRQFQGLEQRLGQDAPAELEIGRSGIARGYANEPSDNQ
ncbi:putative diphthamide synthesis protein-domain-containing protein [Syncephalis plumigaleata]|nr:putative diphthamide synthesis protein-domain-containing protein [Syncephalis plumigaleata]